MLLIMMRGRGRPQADRLAYIAFTVTPVSEQDIDV